MYTMPLNAFGSAKAQDAGWFPMEASEKRCVCGVIFDKVLCARISKCPPILATRIASGSVSARRETCAVMSAASTGAFSTPVTLAHFSSAGRRVLMIPSMDALASPRIPRDLYPIFSKAPQYTWAYCFNEFGIMNEKSLSGAEAKASLRTTGAIAGIFDCWRIDLACSTDPLPVARMTALDP